MIIGISTEKGICKSTIADILYRKLLGKYNVEIIYINKILNDISAEIFNIDKRMFYGHSIESRNWTMQTNDLISEMTDIKNMSPNDFVYSINDTLKNAYGEKFIFNIFCNKYIKNNSDTVYIIPDISNSYEVEKIKNNNNYNSIFIRICKNNLFYPYINNRIFKFNYKLGDDVYIPDLIIPYSNKIKELENIFNLIFYENDIFINLINNNLINVCI